MTVDERKHLERLGHIIRGKRKGKNIKVRDIAEIIGISEREYNRLEADGRGLNSWRLEKVARALGHKAQDLIDMATVF